MEIHGGVLIFYYKNIKNHLDKANSKYLQLH